MSRLPLRARDGTVVAHALVDDADLEWASQWTWRLTSKGYVRRGAGKRGVYVYLHRQVLGLTPGDGLEGDHFSGDKLDNRRANLRVVTHAQQLQNTPSRGGSSRFRGVSWDKCRSRWMAHATVNGRMRNLGHFDSEEEAAATATAFRARAMPYTNEGREVAA